MSERVLHPLAAQVLSGASPELQILAAVQECTSREVLPEQYREMDRGEVLARINELRALLKT